MKRVVLLLAGLLALFALTSAIAFAHDAEVTLTEQNGSGQNGTAELTDMGDGTTKVVLVISSNTADPQPAHIHNGTCAALDPKPVYPLTSVVNGKSETIVNASIAELLSKPYAINVHKSAAEASVYVSCGSIVMATDADSGAGTPGMPTTGSASQNSVFAALAIIALSMTLLGLRLARRKA